MTGLLAVLIAYLLGGIPVGYLLVRWTTGKDVRASGSGNIGATNVLRTTGRGAGIATLLLDIAKGYAAVWVADKLTGGSELWMSAAALAVMLQSHRAVVPVDEPSEPVFRLLSIGERRRRPGDALRFRADESVLLERSIPFARSITDE